MIAEALLFALSLPTTPAPFRRHISPAIGLWSRGRRQARAWRAHLEATRRFIDQATMRASGGTLAILGSGPLFDVPLEGLADRFDRIVLVDQAHLFPARRRAKPCSNVELFWRDLREGLDFLGRVPGLAHVVSANLLSQLAYGAPAGHERRVVETHLAGLAALPCPATLVTDFAYEIVDRRGHVEERFDLLYGAGLPPADAGWPWDLAPFGEESHGRARIHHVAAFADWRRASGAGFPEAPSFAIASAADPVAQQDRAQDS